MEQVSLSLGEFVLDTMPEERGCASFVRKEGAMVEGVASVYRLEGPDGIVMEIEFSKLENGDMRVSSGPHFRGPMWIFGQISGRLTMSVVEKAEGFCFDITLPRPGKRNKSAYTSQSATLDEIEGLHPGFCELLMENGAKDIGERQMTIGDEGSRKRYLNAVLGDHSCLAPVITYAVTRVLAIHHEYKRLVSDGEVPEERTVQGPIGGKSGHAPGESVEATIAGGESHWVEFKPALWYNFDRDQRDPNYTVSKGPSLVRDDVIKSVAGLMNAEGGSLFIGVSDDGDAYGIEKDIAASEKGDHDSFLAELGTMLKKTIGHHQASLWTRCEVIQFRGKDICRIDVKKASSPGVLAETSKEEEVFFARMGNATHKMSKSTMIPYIMDHDWANDSKDVSGTNDS